MGTTLYILVVAEIWNLHIFLTIRRCLLKHHHDIDASIPIKNHLEPMKCHEMPWAAGAFALPATFLVLLLPGRDARPDSFAFAACRARKCQNAGELSVPCEVARRTGRNPNFSVHSTETSGDLGTPQKKTPYGGVPKSWYPQLSSSYGFSVK